jgi:small-conductance mechanosensitive channel
MPELPYLGDIVNSFSPLIVVVIVVVAVLFAARWLLLRDSLNLESERKLSRNLALVGMGLFGLVVIILALPVAANTRQQLLTIVGLIGSGVIALSSTTIVANAMAGLMLRVTKRFRTGDFISVEEQFGRVTKRGLLDTEIQTEDRELTSLPNLYLITNPVSVVRSSGTIVSATLTLGYDVHHARVEPLLMEAAKQVKLEEPFVWIMELGNFSVTYRISGFLADIKSLLRGRTSANRSSMSCTKRVLKSCRQQS